MKSSKLRKNRNLQRRRRHARVRKKVHGTADRPRLVVYRSLRNIEGQLVDDEARQTLLGLSTLAPELKGASVDDEDGRKVGQARAAGKLLAEKAQARGIGQVVFDRGGFKYHGRVRAFAEGAREGGLKF
ncbi:MAG: 50S ribosomal protein L18 [Gemmatimonadetes bacterium]|nr:50S ribosomal protein L18 [Gemmatimonadota bacterium]